MSTQTIEAEPTAPVTFYSRSANLQVTVNPGRAMMQDGNRIVVDYKSANFTDFGDKLYRPDGQRTTVGRLVTSDPEVIAKLAAHPLVMTAAQYNLEATPPDIRERLANDANVRLIAQNNELAALVEKLQKQVEEQNKAKSK